MAPTVSVTLVTAGRESPEGISSSSTDSCCSQKRISGKGLARLLLGKSRGGNSFCLPRWASPPDRAQGPQNQERLTQYWRPVRARGWRKAGCGHNVFRPARAQAASGNPNGQDQGQQDRPHSGQGQQCSEKDVVSTPWASPPSSPSSPFMPTHNMTPRGPWPQTPFPSALPASCCRLRGGRDLEAGRGE